MNPDLERRLLLRSIAPGLGALTLLRTPALHAQNQPAERPVYGGHLKSGYLLEPTALDPVMGRSGGDPYYWRPVFDSLIHWDEKTGLPNAAASLAASWDVSEKPHAITFNLRQGVRFHDGTPFNAEAVKKNYERLLDPNTKAVPRAAYTAIKSIEVLGELKVRLNLDRPWAAAFGLMPGPGAGGAMSSPTAIARLGQDYTWNPVGTGPFKLKEVVTGSHIRLVRNENYWGRDKAGNKLPYLDEITIRIIKDETVLASALRSGEIDIAYLPNREVDAFIAENRFSITKLEGNGVSPVLVFNQDIAPMNDINLRRAVVHAINPADINKAAYFGKSIIADAGLLPVNTWAHAPSATRLSYDLNKARAALAAAGKPNGFDLNILTWNNPSLQQASEIVRAQLGRVGIKANLEVLTVGSSAAKMWEARQTGLMLTSWSRVAEPDGAATLAYKSGGYYNASRQVDAELDGLIEKAAGAYDQGQRTELYRRITDHVLGQVRWHPLLYNVTYAAAAKKVRNVETFISYDGRHNYREIWIRA